MAEPTPDLSALTPAPAVSVAPGATNTVPLALPGGPDGSEALRAKLRIINGYLVEAVEGCTCGYTGDFPADAGHEPHCGYEGLLSVDDLAPALEAAGWRPPLPAEPTEQTYEWGTRDRHGQVHSVGVENEAQARSMLSMTPVCRTVGPWQSAVDRARQAREGGDSG